MLAQYGIRLGLEFIGPYTGRKDKKYTFIYTAEEMLGLAKDCGENVGLLFDAYHWYTGANNRDVFDHIPDERCIVSVHVNDAPDGIDRLELPDSARSSGRNRQDRHCLCDGRPAKARLYGPGRRRAVQPEARRAADR